MAFTSTHTDRLAETYLALGQYPILSGRIRQQMRWELFSRGLIHANDFESEVRRLAILSQEREGVRNPVGEEPPDVWETRVNRIRDQLTDLKFSQHLTRDVLENIISEVLTEQGIDVVGLMLSLNPEVAPLDLVFEQAMTIERLPAADRALYEARLQETKVVLIRTLISDQLRYINIAKRWFSIADLNQIRRHKIGPGKLGGKAAGMLLAYRIISQSTSLGEDEHLVNTPESFFVGSDVFYTFMSINNLFHWNDQKYKVEADMRADYPKIVEEFVNGEFRPDIAQRLEALLGTVGRQPLIVRSSSLLEDNFGTAFAGKYESVFLPNQASPKENLKALTRAIARIYASTLNPNALLYRRARGLQDYDERMAIMIQIVQGEQFGCYYLPHGAGVAFSRNLYRWAPQITREGGFVRLVWGLGTRAVDRVGNDFPRLVALSHPLLRPSTNAKQIRRYSQQYVDLIDLQDNLFKTLPVSEVVNGDYEPLRYLFQEEEDGYFTSLRTRFLGDDLRRLVLTYDEMLRTTPFAERMREILHQLELAYDGAIDLEFTLSLFKQANGKPDVCITLLQCRPQSQLQAGVEAAMPTGLPEKDLIFETHFMVPEGHVKQIDYVLFVPAEGYFNLPMAHLRTELARTIGHLNAALAGEKFICVGPGRWGSANSDLGVPIDYGDIYHTRMLVELTGQGIGLPPEPSLGTHFFQDLLESQIFPVAIYMDEPQHVFRHDFFYETPNRLEEWITISPELKDALRLIRVADYRPNHHLEIVMSDEKSLAVAFLTRNSQDDPIR